MESNIEDTKNNIKEEENEVAELVEGKRVHTSLNLKAINIDALSEIAKDKNLSKTAMMDNAIEIAIREYNNTSVIDQMLVATNGYWFERDIERVREILTPDEARNLTAYQKAYLCNQLNDPKDRQRVFEAVGLTSDLDDIDAINKILEGACKIRDGQLVGFRLPQVANEIRANLSNLQVKYLQLTIGVNATERLKKLIPDKFPKNEIFKESEDSEEAVDLFP